MSDILCVACGLWNAVYRVRVSVDVVRANRCGDRAVGGMFFCDSSSRKFRPPALEMSVPTQYASVRRLEVFFYLYA